MNAYRHFVSRAIAGLLIVLQASCGLSSGPASLTMSIDPTTITLGQSATITWEWKTPEGGFCHASGAWHGEKKAKNSNVVTPTETGTLTYTLECFEDIDATDHRSRTASVTLTVNPAAVTQADAAARAMAAEYAFTTIDYPGAGRTEAHGINNAGQIVGFYFDAAGQHGFMKDGDSYRAFDVGETIESISVSSSYLMVAWGINSAGVVVGTFNDDFGTHRFLKDGADFLPIDVPDALLTVATGINDRGDVVGWFDEGGGKTHGFLATPVDSTSVAIDIAPGNSRNVLDPHSASLIWVGIVSETATAREFDPVSQVDASTVKFGPAGAEHIRYAVRDINRDGLADLLFQFRVREAGLGCDARHASLVGATFGGQRFTGTESIATVGCPSDALAYGMP